MFKEFKEFATRGNIFDMAIGVIIGGAFQKVVNSLVNDIIMPTVSLFTGKIDFNDLCFTFGTVSIRYGSFLTTIINFLIIAFSIFLAVRYVNKLNRKLEQMKDTEWNKLNEKLIKKTGFFHHKQKPTPPPPAPTKKQCPFCFSEVNIHATRCPFCTSQFAEATKSENIDSIKTILEE